MAEIKLPFECPKCGSSLFCVAHIHGTEYYILRCWKTFECGWEIKFKSGNMHKRFSLKKHVQRRGRNIQPKPS